MRRIIRRLQWDLLTVILAASSAAAQPERQAEPLHLVKIQLNYAQASEVARSIKTLPQFRTAEIDLQPQARDNSLLVTGSDEQIREVKRAANLMDVQTRMLMVRAEVVLVLVDSKGEKHRAVLSAAGRGAGGNVIHLTSQTSGDGSKSSGLAMQRGTADVRVTPRLNGDDTISMDATWEIDFTWQLRPGAAPLRVHNAGSGTATARDGNTIVVHSSIVKADAPAGSALPRIGVTQPIGKPGGVEYELMLFLSPSIMKESPQPARDAPSPSARTVPARVLRP